MSYTETAATDDLNTLRENVNEGLRTARFLNVTSKTAAFTALDGETSSSAHDVYLCDATSAAFAVTLPPPTDADPAAGRVVTFKKTDASANAVTVTPDDVGETIDGATSYPLSSQYDFVTIISDGSVWHIVGSS